MALTLYSLSAWGAVTVFVEPRLVDELDPIQLKLRATDASIADAPDLSVLEADFEIIGSQTTSQRRSINGQVQSWVDYQYTLRPKRSGEIPIPPIRVGNQTSAPTTVVVRALDPRVKRSIDNMVFFETEVTVDPVYVQAQTVFVRRLYYASGVQLYSDLPGVPEVANAVIVPLGDTRSSTSLRNGTRYGVIEQRFAIFPEQSGSLTIPEAAITSSVRLRRDGRTRRSGIRIAAPAQTLTVLPVPTEYPASAPWLPATSVTLTEAWTPDRGAYDLGDPITRSVSVTATGNTGSAIPPLEVAFPATHLKAYPEAPSLTDDAKGARVTGRRKERYSLIPTHPGSVVLPPVALTWWDTGTRRVREARLPARTLLLEGASPRAPTETPAQPPTSAQARASGTSTPAVPGSASTIAVALLGTAALACVFVWLAWQLWRGAAQPARKPSRRSALAALKAACARKDLAAVRRCLLVALEIIYGLPPPQALAQFVADRERAALWQELNARLYGPSHAKPSGPALTRGIWRAARRLRASPKRRPPALPDLYAHPTTKVGTPG